MIAPHIAKWALDRQRKSSSDELRAGDIAVPPSASTKKRKKFDEPPVLETKGGGGYVPPPQPTPQEQAAARDWEAAQEFEREQRREATAAEKAAQDKAAADAAWQSGRGSAYNAARTSGSNRLRGLGIESGDPYGVYSQWSGALDQANQGLTTGADYSTAFSPTMLDEILGGARTQQRNKLTNTYNTMLPDYYAEDRFGATSDDAILNSILDQQYSDAMADLQAARGRGQATQSVYDRALRDLNTGKATANTDLQNIGRGVRQSDIENVNKRRTSSLGNIANWDFGTTYDPAAETGRVRSYADELGSTLEGDIRGAVGSREFFDVNSLLGKASARIGNQTTPTTTGTAALQDTFANEATRNAANAKANEGIF